MQILKRHTRLILQRKKRMKENEAYDNLFIKKKSIRPKFAFYLELPFSFYSAYYGI